MSRFTLNLVLGITAAILYVFFFFFSSRRRHTRSDRDWSSDVCSSDLALNIATGEMVWEIPQLGPQEANYSGVLSTAGGLLFYGETGGRFAAVDAKTGKTLVTFKAAEPWKASPMTYMVKGRQHVAIASGGNILSFALPDRQDSHGGSR